MHVAETIHWQRSPLSQHMQGHIYRLFLFQSDHPLNHKTFSQFAYHYLFQSPSPLAFLLVPFFLTILQVPESSDSLMKLKMRIVSKARQLFTASSEEDKVVNGEQLESRRQSTGHGIALAFLPVSLSNFFACSSGCFLYAILFYSRHVLQFYFGVKK